MTREQCHRAGFHRTEAARRRAGANSNTPIELVDGKQGPVLCGIEAHYVTAAGIRIAHPIAYSQNGWSNMVYVPSTVRVVVGRNWEGGKG